MHKRSSCIWFHLWLTYTKLVNRPKMLTFVEFYSNQESYEKMLRPAKLDQSTDKHITFHWNQIMPSCNSLFTDRQTDRQTQHHHNHRAGDGHYTTPVPRPCQAQHLHKSTVSLNLVQPPVTRSTRSASPVVQPGMNQCSARLAGIPSVRRMTDRSHYAVTHSSLTANFTRNLSLRVEAVSTEFRQWDWYTHFCLPNAVWASVSGGFTYCLRQTCYC